MTHRKLIALLNTSGLCALALAQDQSAKPAATPAAPVTSPGTSASTAKAVFAGDCFWCVESDFDRGSGVLSTTSGYTGGKTANPTYEEVSRHTTGHAKAVEVVYDPAKVSYAEAGIQRIGPVS